MITLHHHPHSRAANVVWQLEELGLQYELEHVDFHAGANRTPEFKKLNPMGKLPTLVDHTDAGDVVVTEGAAIAVYLADRYSLGELAPALDAPERATYLRWIFYSPSVIEPGCTAHSSGWEFNPGSVGWGRYETMLDTISEAIGDGPYLLGERFSMADTVLGGTLGFMLVFNMIEKRPEYQAYIARLGEREAYKRAGAINAKVLAETQK